MEENNGWERCEKEWEERERMRERERERGERKRKGREKEKGEKKERDMRKSEKREIFHIELRAAHNFLWVGVLVKPCERERGRNWGRERGIKGEKEWEREQREREGEERWERER
jgi:hypothetical protein